jgi:hypothetical protein
MMSRRVLLDADFACSAHQPSPFFMTERDTAQATHNHRARFNRTNSEPIPGIAGFPQLRYTY